MLLSVVLLSTFGYSSDFPLTSLPEEYRDLLKLGLAITYVVNTGVAVYAAILAGGKGLSPTFWAAKCFVLGGVALEELANIESRRPGSK